MSIKATILRDSVGNIIVQLKGYLDYASSRPLRETLEDVYLSYNNVEIKIDMSGVSFIGSSGISHYVNTMKSIYQTELKTIQLTNVDKDFKRVFELYGLSNNIVEIENFSLDDDWQSKVKQKPTRA